MENDNETVDKKAPNAFSRNILFEKEATLLQHISAKETNDKLTAFQMSNHTTFASRMLTIEGERLD